MQYDSKGRKYPDGWPGMDAPIAPSSLFDLLGESLDPGRYRAELEKIADEGKDDKPKFNPRPEINYDQFNDDEVRW